MVGLFFDTMFVASSDRVAIKVVSKLSSCFQVIHFPSSVTDIRVYLHCKHIGFHKKICGSPLVTTALGLPYLLVNVVLEILIIINN